LTSLSQDPCDSILWILSEHGGKMERIKLRRAVMMRYAMFNPILEELAREGKISIIPVRRSI
jgi:hypothetical protein